jgi:hypothetical protein
VDGDVTTKEERGDAESEVGTRMTTQRGRISWRPMEQHDGTNHGS